jgi:hypothetical protein
MTCVVRYAKPRCSWSAAAGHGRFQFMHHVSVCSNSPVGTSRAKALRLTEETATTIVGNLRNRYFRADVVPVEA